MLNRYFSHSVKTEQTLYEDIIIESLQMYGYDMYYIPRDIVNLNTIFSEDVSSQYNSSYKVEMYIDNVDGFDGEGDLFSKFGIEIRDAATFIVSRRRWDQTVRKNDNEITSSRPLEGDLLYFPMTNKIFQIMHVEHERPFYQIDKLNVYALRCELFEYSDEQFDTRNPDIDVVENAGYVLAFRLDNYTGNLDVGQIISQTLTSGITVLGKIVNVENDVVRTAHIGSTGNSLHEFSIGESEITDSAGNVFTADITEINEDLSGKVDHSDDYEDISNEFIDFSENNPFGGIRNS